MKRFTLLLLALFAMILPGCGGVDVHRYATEVSSFGERNFDKLDRNHDGTVNESELWEAQAAPGFTASEKDLIKLIRENLSVVGHITGSEQYQSIDPITIPDGNGGFTFIYIPSTNTRYFYGVSLTDFKNFSNQQIRR